MRLKKNKPLMMIVLCSFLLTSTLFLASCGEEGAGVVGDGNANSAPKANAGPDQHVTTGSPVILDGSGSSDANGDKLSYNWSFTSRPDGSAAALNSATVVNPSFTADKDGSYVLRLFVSDGQVESAPDTITITASSTNSAPVANAGPDQNVTTGSQVTLDGSGSADANGDALIYNWSFTSKPAGSAAALSSSSVAGPSFTADVDGAYVLSLFVNDGRVDSAADTVTITASSTNSAPVADAGPDQNVAKGSQVTLDGSGSSDANGNALGYNWSFTSKPIGSTAALSSPTVINPTFTADKDGAYVVSLVVNDGQVDSAADTATITATTSNVAPLADPGNDQNVATGSVVALNGSESSDANGDSLTYNWSFTSKPGGSSATLSSSTVASPTFTADVDGLYVISLVVNDGQVNSLAETVAITSATAVPLVRVPDANQYTQYAAGDDGSYSINSLSYTDNNDGTITDTVTGLIWQKAVDGTPRLWDAANTYCNSNEAGLPGTTGWRLPTRMELAGLPDYGRGSDPWINTSYFTGTQNAYYWSSSAYAPQGETYAWALDFQTCGMLGAIKSNAATHVRCVRGQSAAPSYTDNNDDTVKDNATGLIWQKQDDAGTWAEALTYCENLSLATRSDWRLPNIKELLSLVDDSRFNKSIDPVFSAQADNYWASTTCNGFCTGSAWVVNFNNGGPNKYYTKTNSARVRCVRGQ